jgi:prepilin peptidase CpaA
MTTFQLLSWSLAAAYAGLFIAAAVIDFLKRKIPNWTVLALFVVFLIAALSKVLLLGAWWAPVTAGVIAFVVTFALYVMKVLGAGDAKLFTVAALFSSSSGLVQLALVTAIAGGVLAIGYLLARPNSIIGRLVKPSRTAEAGRGIPYGIAIAVGALATAFLASDMFGLRL